MGQRHRRYLDEVENEMKVSLCESCIYDKTRCHLAKGMEKVYACIKYKTTHDDRLAELEAYIRDYYVAKGRELDGTWEFRIIIGTRYKYKPLSVIYTDENGSRLVFTVTRENTKDMFDAAFEFFTCKEK